MVVKGEGLRAVSSFLYGHTGAGAREKDGGGLLQVFMGTGDGGDRISIGAFLVLIDPDRSLSNLRSVRQNSLSPRMIVFPLGVCVIQMDGLETWACGSLDEGLDPSLIFAEPPTSITKKYALYIN